MTLTEKNKSDLCTAVAIFIVLIGVGGCSALCKIKSDSKPFLKITSSSENDSEKEREGFARGVNTGLDTLFLLELERDIYRDVHPKDFPPWNNGQMGLEVCKRLKVERK